MDRRTWTLLVVACAAARDFTSSADFPAEFGSGKSVSYAKSDEIAVVFGNSDKSLGLVYCFRSGNATEVRGVPGGKHPAALAFQSGFLLHWQAASSLHLTLLSQSGSETARKTIEIHSPFPVKSSVLAMDSLVFVWEQWESDGNSYGIQGLLLDSRLETVKSPFRINSYTQGKQTKPCVSAIDGGFLVAWVGNEGKNGVFAQKFDQNGGKIDSEVTIATGIAFQSLYFSPGVALVALRADSKTFLASGFLLRLRNSGEIAGNLTEISQRKLRVPVYGAAFSPVARLDDGDLLVALNREVWPEDRTQTSILRIAESGCVCSEDAFPGLGSALDIRKAAGNRVEVAYWNETSRAVSVWSAALSVECSSQSASAFPVEWERVSLSSSAPGWRVAAIVAPALVCVLLICLFLATLRALLRRKPTEQPLSVPQSEPSFIDKFVDSLSPLSSSHRVAATLSVKSCRSELQLGDPPDIIADIAEFQRVMQVSPPLKVRATS